MALKKLSISDEQIEMLEVMLSKGEKICVIAEKIRVSRITLWRNMAYLGINKQRAKPTKKNKPKEKYFNIDEFKNHYKY